MGEAISLWDAIEMPIGVAKALAMLYAARRKQGPVIRFFEAPN